MLAPSRLFEHDAPLPAFRSLHGRPRIAIAAVCALAVVLLAQYPGGDPGSSAAWLALTGLLYWRLSRGGLAAYATASVLAAFGAAIVSVVVAQQLLGAALTAHLSVMLVSFCVEALFLWSSPVATEVAAARVRRQG